MLSLRRALKFSVGNTDGSSQIFSVQMNKKRMKGGRGCVTTIKKSETRLIFVRYPKYTCWKWRMMKSV